MGVDVLTRTGANADQGFAKPCVDFIKTSQLGQVAQFVAGFDVFEVFVVREFQKLIQMTVLHGAERAFIGQHHKAVLIGQHGHGGEITGAAEDGIAGLVLEPVEHFDAFVEIADFDALKGLPIAQLHFKCCASLRLIILRREPKLVRRGGQGDSQSG